MPVYEILSVPASDLLAQDHSLFQPLIDHMSGADGILEVRYGFTEENEKNFYGIIKWETLDHHKAVRQSPGHANFREKMQPLVAGKPQVVHIEFEKDPSAAFDAPVTEITWFLLKDGITKANIKEIVNQEAGSKMLTLPGIIPGAAWNETIEDPSKCVLFGGWESSKHHIDGIKQEMFKEPFGKMMTLADHTTEHVSFHTAFKK
ncbi:hypothetical protein CPB83DRAFT_910065 [Crepidotus variabilis]|uniref:ABM domain-containing protein n=1 Tax=Crepidotus variabilis TaxID=179855 RepID=A0A9P6JKI7_9AGAR|nr:hypothetical protein CPB83DRAFT_910065 [Crepidotus variabilis]